MPSSASATTNASVSINYVLSSSTFNYTWSESGLPSGTQWGIDVNGNNYTTTSSSLTETFSTGQTYSWSVINPSGYVGIPDSGSFSSPGSQSITFYTTPSVSISVNSSSGVAPLTVTYTASASGGSGNYEYNFYYMNNNQQYQWTGWQTSNTFTYTYNSNGKYSAMVEVEDTVTGATVKSNYVQVTVSAPPPLSVTISAYPMQGVAPLNVSFVSNVQGGSGSYSYYWTFGDGGTSTSANPSHTYTSPGTYNVQLEVTSGSQTAYSNTLTITVTQEQLQASINANPTSGVAPLTVTYTASATGGSGSYQYDFYYETNSGTFVWSGWQSSNSISYTYTVYTTVQAYVEVKDTVTGVMAMSSPVQVTITPPPLSVTANANPTSGTAPLTVSFTASTSGGSGGNSYSWNFGDGSTSTQQNPTHTYNNPGTYTATVTVTDSYGQQASASVTISVSPAPLQVSIHAYPTSGSEPLTVNFYSSVSGGVGNYQYYWTFGDGATSTQANPTYTYNNPGTYTVQLKVTSGPQTAYSNRITITVDYPPLHVSIRASTTYGNAPLTVHFYSTVSGGTGRYSYYWMFGDGGSSTAANPTHTYYKGGTYYVKLFVRSGSQSAYSNIIAIKVVVPTYSYTFHESGLPTGAVWKVTMNGQTKSAGAGQSITFTGLSGSNSWSAPAVTVYEGPWWHRVRVTYYPHPSSGTVSGSGSTTISYMV
jgi:PKD repeat protein